MNTELYIKQLSHAIFNIMESGKAEKLNGVLINSTTDLLGRC